MRRSLASLLGACALVASALVIAPTANAVSGGLAVTVTGKQIVITAAADLTGFAATETLVVTAGKRDITILMDEGTARLWSNASACMIVPQSSPVTSITCKGAFTGVTMDFSAVGVTTQSGVTGVLPLTFLGGSGADGVYSGSGADRILGAEGDDDLFGGSNDDTIDGGPGTDTIEGELGSDWMYGGPGVDDIEAQDRIADKAIDCGANTGDKVSYDIALETPVACTGATVTVMHPRAGPQGGAMVSIQGRGLADVTAVYFGGAQGSIVSATDSRVLLMSPAGSGSAAVSLRFGGTTMEVGTYVYAPPPVLTAVTPGRGRAGTAITLSGGGLSRVTRVLVAGVAVRAIPQMDGTLVVTAPGGTRLGTVDISIVTLGGQSTLRNAFRYTS